MKIGIKNEKPESVKTDVLVVLCTQEYVSSLNTSGSSGVVEEEISSVVRHGDFKGESDQSFVFYSEKISASCVLLTGAGEESKIDLEKIRTMMCTVVQHTR